MIPIFETRLNEAIFYAVFYTAYGADIALTYIAPLIRRRLKIKKDKTYITLVTTLLATIFLSLYFGYLSYYTGIGVLPLPSLYIGLALIAAGEWLRLWAIATLGKYFSPVVTVFPDHKVVTRGPYRLARHPAYGGALISLLGLALATRSAFSLPLVLLNAAVYNNRANTEEKLLTESLGDEYVKYKSKVRKKFIPFLW